jgi:hypothetical protein
MPAGGCPIGRRLLQVVALAAVVFAVWQYGLASPPGHAVASAVDRLEAADADQPQAVAALASGDFVIVRLLGAAAPRALLLRNNLAVADFRSGVATVKVRPGDVLDVDGDAYRRPLTFQVVAAGPDLASPRAGTQVTTMGSTALLGRVVPPSPRTVAN